MITSAHMSIRTKSLLFIGLGIFSIVITAIYSSATIFLKRFDELEMDRAKVNLERVSQAFDVEKSNLSVKLSDWSTWDDSYKVCYGQKSIL
jgi:sensor domain CHASE-containing protein